MTGNVCRFSFLLSTAGHLTCGTMRLLSDLSAGISHLSCPVLRDHGLNLLVRTIGRAH